ANGLLDDLGLGARSDAAPSQLSGGEQQRVALARALANSPDIVMGDEPHGPHMGGGEGPPGTPGGVGSRDVLGLFAAARDRGQTLLVVTHDARVAAAADRMITLPDGIVVEEAQLAPPRPVTLPFDPPTRS